MREDRRPGVLIFDRTSNRYVGKYEHDRPLELVPFGMSYRFPQVEADVLVAELHDRYPTAVLVVLDERDREERIAGLARMAHAKRRSA